MPPLSREAMPPEVAQRYLRAHLQKIVSLTEDEVAGVVARFTLKRYKKHQFLIQEGELVQHQYFVVAGLLKLVYTDAADKAHLLAFAPEDWWETDLAAYSTQTPATCSLQCLKDTTVLCLTLTDYRQICTELPPLARFFLHRATRGAMAAQQRLLSLLSTSAQERYEQLLHQYPALGQRVSKTLLASYLGVSRETLSRLMA